MEIKKRKKESKERETKFLFRDDDFADVSGFPAWVEEKAIVVERFAFVVTTDATDNKLAKAGNFSAHIRMNNFIVHRNRAMKGRRLKRLTSGGCFSFYLLSVIPFVRVDPLP